MKLYGKHTKNSDHFFLFQFYLIVTSDAIASDTQGKSQLKCAQIQQRRCCSFISYSWIHHISKWDQIQKIGNFPNEFWVRNWLKLNQWVRFWLILPLGSWNLTNIHPLSHWVKFLWLTWERVLKCIEWSNKLNLLIELQFSFFSICFSQDVRL